MIDLFRRSDRSGIFADRMRKLGYEIEEAKINGELVLRYTSPGGQFWVTSSAKTAYPMNSSKTYDIANNKQLSYDIAQKLGISIPDTRYISSFEDVKSAKDLLHKNQCLVVKPLDGYFGQDVSVGIDSEERLESVLNNLLSKSSVAIVQQQIYDEEYRFTVLEGKVVSVVLRKRPQVKGDGKSTIEKLVKNENDIRRNLKPGGISYPLWTEELLGDVVHSQEVLEKDEIRIFSGSTIPSTGSSLYEVIEEVHPDYIKMAETFAQTIGAGLLAFDVFIRDHRQLQNYWFNECNTSQALKLILAVMNKDNTGVVDHIVKRIAEKIEA